MHKIHRYHDISAGHRVCGHESKCRHLHGHNYRIHFTCKAEELDSLGRVVDFGVVKEKLCMWVEEFWDHKFLHYECDGLINTVKHLMDVMPPSDDFDGSFVALPFNPTAENMAQHLVDVIGPMQLEGTGVTLTEVTIDETAKCSATYIKEL